jgi:hypothetical protein
VTSFVDWVVPRLQRAAVKVSLVLVFRVLLFSGALSDPGGSFIQGAVPAARQASRTGIVGSDYRSDSIAETYAIGGSPLSRFCAWRLPESVEGFNQRLRGGSASATMGKSKLTAKFRAGVDESWRVPLASASDKDEFEVIESRGNGAAASGKKDKKRKKAPEGDRGEEPDSPYRKKNANLKRREEAEAEPSGNDRDGAGSSDQTMRKKKKKTKTKTKTEGTTMEHGPSKNEGSREGQAAHDPRGVTVHVFPTDDADHAETPRVCSGRASLNESRERKQQREVQQMLKSKAQSQSARISSRPSLC